MSCCRPTGDVIAICCFIKRTICGSRFLSAAQAEAILAAGAPWTESKRIVKEAIGRLNDFIGYRPVPVLETHEHAAYVHERVRPVPLYIAGAGVAVGKYRELIEQTLEILRHTEPEFSNLHRSNLQGAEQLAFDAAGIRFQSSGESAAELSFRPLGSRT